MNLEQMKQNLSDAGCRGDRITEIMTLCERGHVPEAIQKMKSDRCRLIDELHECGRKEENRSSRFSDQADRKRNQK